MKLIKVDFNLDWPLSIESKDLRKYIMNKLVKKGKIIRWSIIDIQDSIDALDIKKLNIHAVLAD
tara:strand:+ start:692 stop:883 length:192 start_codon:yes stop_codon:yes gene_type:complete